MKIYVLHYGPTDSNIYSMGHPKDMFEHKSEFIEFLEKKVNTELENLYDCFYDCFASKQDETAYDKLCSNKKEYRKQFNKWVNSISWQRFTEMCDIEIKSVKVIV